MLFCQELLVHFADKVVSAVINKHVLCKKRLGIITDNACFEAVVSGFNVTVTVINSDNFQIVKL